MLKIILNMVAWVIIGYAVHFNIVQYFEIGAAVFLIVLGREMERNNVNK